VYHDVYGIYMCLVRWGDIRSYAPTSGEWLVAMVADTVIARPENAAMTCEWRAPAGRNPTYNIAHI
jgi:hypothetical protein